ncbi:MAG: hypothetical protein AAFO29_14125 [Actinomycetota bacterium]
MTVSIDAAGAMRQIVGIMGDNGWSGVTLDEAMRGELLDARLLQSWSPEEWERMEGEERTIELELEDAAMLLGGLSFTEMMSVDFPWIDLLRWCVDFIGAELRPLWTEEEWALLAAG